MMQWWLSTRVGRYTGLLHDEHHRRCFAGPDKRDDHVNLNLNSGGFGDMLCGTFRRPSMATLLSVNYEGGLH